MHPYEMAATLKQRHKEDSIKLRYGSLYTVIELLLARGFIQAQATSREGRRPERTVYALTDAGRDELYDWMRDLLRDPVKEYPQFEAGLCLMPVLPPDEATGLLADRAAHLAGQVAQLEAQLAALTQQPLSAAAAGARGSDKISAAVHRRGRIPARHASRRARIRHRAHPPDRRGEMGSGRSVARYSGGGLQTA